MSDAWHCCCIQERSLQEENKALQKEVSCCILLVQALAISLHAIRTMNCLMPWQKKGCASLAAAGGEAEVGQAASAAAGSVGPADPDSSPSPDKLIVFLVHDEAGSAGTPPSIKHLVHTYILTWLTNEFSYMHSSIYLTFGCRIAPNSYPPVTMGKSGEEAVAAAAAPGQAQTQLRIGSLPPWMLSHLNA